MIQNLNQENFSGFGYVLPERASSLDTGKKEESSILKLAQSEIPVFLTKSETKLSCGKGIGVLSVSIDAENYSHYYLDKTVSINPNVYIALNAFKGDATVLVKAKAMPESVGTRANYNLRIDNRMQVDGIYTFFYQEKEQGFIFNGESHPMIELTYVDKGELHSVVEGQDTVLAQGDVVVYGPDQWHMQYSDQGIAPCFVTISFDISGIDLLSLYNRKLRMPQSALPLLQNMLREQKRTDDFSSDVINAELKLLLLNLLREVSKPGPGKIQGINSVHNENEVIRKAQQYISEHIREKLSVPDVARVADVSASYLTVLFHKNLQISPGEYIRRLKLQESKQMIRENNLNFTEIASVLQYSTVHHFSRQFKEKFGITPTEYAKSVR